MNRMLGVDAETQLPDDLLLTDKMSMAVVLECRVPLLDHELVELAARIPAGVKVRGGRLKHVMKAALADVLPRAPGAQEARLRHADGRVAQGRPRAAPASLLSEDSIRAAGSFDIRR